jgi:hypothetical protein
MDSTDEDQRKPHRQDPNVPGTPETLKSIGVLSWKLDADKYENDPKLEAIRKVCCSIVYSLCGAHHTSLPLYVVHQRKTVSSH